MERIGTQETTKRGSALLRLLVLATAAVGFFALASPAFAAQANMWDNNGAIFVVYDGDPGETNNVTFSRCGAACVDIVDQGAQISAGWGILMPYGCSGASPARCEYPGGRIDSILVNLADGDDRAVMGLALPSTGATFVNGESGADTLIGGPGFDNLRGGVGNDSLFGAGSCDVLSGQDDHDVLDGGTGADLIDGDGKNGGEDTVDYSGRSAPVYVSLDRTVTGGVSCTTIGNDGEAGEGDNVNEDVEHVTGGGGSDVLVGSVQPNVLQGGPGNDLLDGRGSPDDLLGGDGVDEALYRDRTAAVFVTLGDGMRNDGEANELDFVDSEVEHVTGGSGNDELTGTAAANSVWGGPGNDTLVGLGGDDTLSGGGDDDKLNGGPGTDTLYGHDGADELDARDSTLDDTVDCGDGADSAYADYTGGMRSGYLYEAVSNCETISWTAFQPQPPSPRGPF